MNVFLQPEVAKEYDAFYQTGFGKQVDTIEKQIISELLIDIPRLKLADLGCGTGHWTDFFVRQGFNVTGVDISEPMIEIARGKNINADFLLADSENLPFENESFDIVASVTMMEFVENQETVKQETHRILKKGGWLILGCLNANSILGKNKEKDEVFKNATFIDISKIRLTFKPFELQQIKSGVYLNTDYRIMDHTNYNGKIEPVFTGALFQKQ